MPLYCGSDRFFENVPQVLRYEGTRTRTVDEKFMSTLFINVVHVPSYEGTFVRKYFRTFEGTFVLSYYFVYCSPTVPCCTRTRARLVHVRVHQGVIRG